jgi:DNA-binding CsgD family transcriptional regulator
MNSDRDAVKFGQTLTNAEFEIYELLVSDLMTFEIADTKKISVRTVKFHSSRIYKKLGVSSRYSLIIRHYINEIARLAA